MAKQRDKGSTPTAPAKHNKFGFVSVRVHRYGWENLEAIAKALRDRVNQGSNLPVRVQLGKAHLFDTVTEVAAKTWNIELPQ